MGTPLPPPLFLAGPLYYALLVVYDRLVYHFVYQLLAVFLLIIINLDPTLVAFMHSFLCDVDVCKKLFPQQPAVVSVCCLVMS